MGCWNVSDTGSKIEGVFIPETSGVEGADVFHMQSDTQLEINGWSEKSTYRLYSRCTLWILRNKKQRGLEK